MDLAALGPSGAGAGSRIGVRQRVGLGGARARRREGLRSVGVREHGEGGLVTIGLV